MIKSTTKASEIIESQNAHAASMGDFGKRHTAAWHVHSQRAFAPRSLEGAIVHLIEAWALYSDAWMKQYGEETQGDGDGYENIATDGYLSMYWPEIGKALQGMLSCDHGSRLDGGTLSAIICKVLMAQGFTDEGEVKP